MECCRCLGEKTHCIRSDLDPNRSGRYSMSAFGIELTQVNKIILNCEFRVRAMASIYVL